MSVKTELLRLLEAYRDRDLSGQEIANLLGVSRTAVWKAANALKADGYEIEGVNNRGYRLREDSDLLSREGILLHLKEEYQDRDIVVSKVLDSTNQEIKRRALEGAREGLVVLAEEQTAGKGRRGRQFVSPFGTGIYMSVLFRPVEQNADDIVLITTAASVAICRAIREVTGEKPEIKWVNDVYLRGKKVCGILTEAVSDFESGRIGTVIVGIGINYREPEGGFPDELKEIAGAVLGNNDTESEKKLTRNVLVAAVLNELYSLYEGLAERTFMVDYKMWSNVIGKEIRFSESLDSFKHPVWQYGKALDIDRDGGLVVKMQNGKMKTLRTGEITVRVV